MASPGWYEDLTRTIMAAPPRCGRVRVVAVDGPAGSGKSTFAVALAAALGGAPIVHTDDLASHDDLFGWWPRLVGGVLEPLAAGHPGAYRPYDWTRRALGPPRTVPVSEVVIVEGVGAGRRELASWLSYLIWMDGDTATAHDRGLRRDLGAHATRWHGELVEFWQRWAAAEESHFAADPTRDRADLVVSPI